MIDSITNIVLHILGFQLILLTAVIFVQKSGRMQSLGLLAAFLLTKTIIVLRWLLFKYGVFDYVDDQIIFRISGALFFLLAPFVYLYICSLCYRDFRITTKQILHLIPFFLFIVYVILNFYFKQKQDISYGFVKELCVIQFWNVFWASNFIQILIYILAIFKIIIFYRKNLKDQYANIEHLDLSWLFSLLLLISLHWIFIVSRSVLSLLGFERLDVLHIIDLFSLIIFLIFTTFLVFRGLKQLKMFSGIERKPYQSADKIKETEKQACLEKLNNAMLAEKLFLTPSLTLDELSEKLSIPSWQLSYIINSCYNQNFFNFINTYRVEEFKKQILDPSNKRKTILELLYEVGFNSKSTFNDVFKRQTGMTPTKFKKVHQN